MTDSSDVSLFCSPPLSALGLFPGPCRTLGFSPVVFPSVSLVYLPLPPCALLRLPSSYGAFFLIGCIFASKRKGPGLLQSLAVDCPRSSLSLATRPCWSCSGYPDTLPPSPSPSPPCLCGPIPIGGRSVGRSTRSRCKGQLDLSW